VLDVDVLDVDFDVDVDVEVEVIELVVDPVVELEDDSSGEVSSLPFV
jgi:hypothetical protein